MIGDQPKSKIPYAPSQELRYELSADEISRKRFRALMAICKELQKDLPQIPISFCLFGSLTKGKVLTAETASNADIDFDVKYDAEAITASTLKEKRETASKFEFLIEETIKKKMEEKKEGLELGEIHFDVNPIDSFSIQRALDNVGSSDFVYKTTGGIEKKSAQVVISLALYFTLSIGNAVKKYRDKYLRYLSKMIGTDDEEEAREIWSRIKECVETVERQGQIPEKTRKQFPQTLEEALKFYEVDTN